MDRDKHFMVDIEATGVDFDKDEILEIGIVEMLWTPDGYWKAGKEFHRFIHSDRQPESEFAKAHMAEVYRQANNTPSVWASVTRTAIVDFFRACGKEGHEVLLCGWNAANFDVPFLHKAVFLKPPGYETVDGKDRQVGDHHYRIYEMCGAIQFMCDSRREPYDLFKEKAKGAYPMGLPEGKKHDAIYDCHAQIKLLNGLIRISREGI